MDDMEASTIVEDSEAATIMEDIEASSTGNTSSYIQDCIGG